MIFTLDTSLPNVNPQPALNLILKLSDPSTTSSQVTDILALPSVAPALMVIVNGLELKSIPDPTHEIH